MHLDSNTIHDIDVSSGKVAMHVVLLCRVAPCCAVPCRFIVQDTVEENVARLSRERAAAMDMTAAVPVKGAGAAEAAQLSVREVAALVCSKWSDRQAS
jgi:hypothetical protein